MKAAGWILLVTGIVLTTWASVVDVSVPSGLGNGRTINIGLQQQQLMIYLGGLSSTLAGVIVAALAALRADMILYFRNIATNLHAVTTIADERIERRPAPAAPDHSRPAPTALDSQPRWPH